MPTYSYYCIEHGFFEKLQRMADHAQATCECGRDCPQKILHAPGLDIEGMADAGCPGAFETSGDRMTQRHRSADKAGDWASRDSTEFRDSVGEDRKGDFMKAFADKVAASEE